MTGADAVTKRWARGVGIFTGLLVAITLARGERLEVLLAVDGASWPWTAVLWLRLSALSLLAAFLAERLFVLLEGVGDARPATGAGGRGAACAVFLLVVAVGAALRMAFPGTHPPGPWSDVYQEAMPLLRNPHLPWIGGTPLLPGASGNSELVSHLYLRFYALVFALFGRGETGFLALSAIPGALVPAAAGGIAWRLGGRHAGLAAAALAAFAGWPLVTSRWGYITVAMTALVLGATFAALRALGAASPAWGAAAGFLAGLSLHTYVAAWGAVACLALAGAWAAVSLPRMRPAVLVAFAAGTLAFLPFVPGYLAHRDNVGGRTRDIGLWTPSRDVSLPVREGPAALPVALLHNAYFYAGVFAGAEDPTPRHGLHGGPTLPWVVGAAGLLGAAASLRRAGSDPAHALLAAVAFGGLLPGLLSRAEGMPNTVRAGVFVAVVFVWAAFTLERLGRWIAARRRLARHAYWGLAIGSVVVLETGPFLSRWPDDPRTVRAFCVVEAEAGRLRGALAREPFIVDPALGLNRDVLDGLGADPDPAVPVPHLPAVTPEELAAKTLEGPLWFLTTRAGAARLAGGTLATSRPTPLATGATGPVLVRVAPRRPAG